MKKWKLINLCRSFWIPFFSSMAFTSTPVNLSNCKAFYMYTVGTQVWTWRSQGVSPLECFSVFQELLFVCYCFLLWILFHVFSIFCITSLIGNHNCPQHRETTPFSTVPEASHLDRYLFFGVPIHYTQKALCAVTRGGQVHYYEQITWSYTLYM